MRPAPLGRRWATHAAVIAVCGPVVAGCGATPPRSQFPTADAALGRMHAGYDCAYGVQGTAKIDHLSPKGRVKGELDFFAVVPESVRFDAEKFGVMVYTLTSDGKDFKMLDTQQKEFLYGPANACNLARLTQVPLPGHALVNILRGEAPVLMHEPIGADLTWDSGGYYVVHLDSTNNAEEEIHLQVFKEDYEKPWDKQRVRVKYVKVTQATVDLYEVELDNHKPVKTAGERVDPDGIEDPILPIGPACEAEIPFYIRMQVPNTSDDVVFRYQEDPPPVWNPPLVEGTFTQPVPGGVQQVHVDCE